ncbi:MAG TPA: chemotaxis protein CheC [Solirubrobacteraceae bacterium]|nr:chemotaxis protein CheC [Solirubrobacteraceae bacterium]
MTPDTYTEAQLDGLRELANVGSGQASTALSQMTGRPVDVSVPHANALPVAEAVESIGPAEAVVTGVAVPVVGEMGGVVLILLRQDDADAMCRLLGVEPDDEMALSALCEIGNILGSCYLGTFATMAGVAVEPAPPQVAVDMLGALAQTVLATSAEQGDTALLLDSELAIEGVECAFSLLLVPDAEGIGRVLDGMGLAA